MCTSLSPWRYSDLSLPALDSRILCSSSLEKFVTVCSQWHICPSEVALLVSNSYVVWICISSKCQEPASYCHLPCQPFTLREINLCLCVGSTNLSFPAKYLYIAMTGLPLSGQLAELWLIYHEKWYTCTYGEQASQPYPCGWLQARNIILVSFYFSSLTPNLQINPHQIFPLYNVMQSTILLRKGQVCDHVIRGLTGSESPQTNVKLPYSLCSPYS